MMKEDVLKIVFDNAVDGILVADAQTKRFVLCNKTMQRMLGYTEEELLSLGVDSIHPKESLERVNEEFEAQAGGKFTLSKAIPMLRKDNSIFYADVNATMVKIQGKQCLVGIFRDITDRMKVNFALERQVSYQKSLVNISAAGTECPFDEFIEKAMGDIGQTLQGDRAILYILEDDSKARMASYWYSKKEFASKAVDIKLKDLGMHMDKLREAGVTTFTDIDPQIKRRMKRILERTGSKSLIISVLYYKGKPHGSIVVGDCTRSRDWNDSEKAYLQSASQVISICLENSIIQRQIDERLLSAEVVSKIALCFMGKEPFDKKIESSLEYLGSALDAPRTYLFIQSPDGDRWDDAYEWSWKGHKSHKNMLKNLKTEDFKQIIERLKKNEMVVIPEAIKCDDSRFKSVLEAVGSKGGLGFPIIVGGKLWGALGYGFSSAGIGWGEEELTLLATVSGMIAWLVENEKR